MNCGGLSECPVELPTDPSMIQVQSSTSNVFGDLYDKIFRAGEKVEKKPEEPEKKEEKPKTAESTNQHNQKPPVVPLDNKVQNHPAPLLAFPKTEKAETAEPKRSLSQLEKPKIK